ncbi:MAG: stage III sporulation protein AE [Ruminococcus sp.]|nr:stage III sporulation protein AE [Ruminococcus sp.]
MIRRAILTIIVMLLFTPIVSSAEDYDEKSEFAIDEYRKSIDSSLSGALDDETADSLDRYGIYPASSSDSFNISSVISGVTDRFKASLSDPVKILGKLIAICAFTVLVKSLTEGSSYGELYDTSAILVNICVIYSNAELAVSSLKTALDDISAFMLTYIPVFSSVIASGAAVTSAAGYYTVMFTLCEMITFVATNLLLPITGIVFALNIVGAVNGNISLDGLCASLKSLTKWILTALMTVFTAVLSLKGITGASVDSVASRTMRFAASSFIPIVGGSVSEAYSTIYGSLGIIRSSVGLFGIGAVAVITLRPVITVIAYKFVISLGGIINELFGQSRTASLLRGLAGVLDIALGIMIAMAMIFIISTAIIMLTTMNTI